MSRTGDIIQEMRVKAGSTQKSLAEALHITDKAISKWERGICLPETALLSKLALLLDIDVNQLVSTSLEENDWVGLISIKGCDLSQKYMINLWFTTCFVITYSWVLQKYILTQIQIIESIWKSPGMNSLDLNSILKNQKARM